MKEQEYQYSVSVVIIGYNIEKYIGRCLDSVFGQDYNNYEVIFVDDGSTDRTLEIARTYEEKKREKAISYRVISKMNGGIISARKTGVFEAQNDYILFVDGDDYINFNMISSLVAGAKKYPNSTFDIIMSDHWEEKNEEKYLVRKSNFSYGTIEGDFFLRGILEGNIYHYIFPKLYRREFLLDKGYLQFPDITIAEDLYTNSVLGIYNPKVLYLDLINYYYQYNTNSVTRNGSTAIIDKNIETINLIEDKLISYAEDKYREHIEYQWYLLAFGYIQTGFSHEFKRYLVDKCKSHLKRIKANSLYKKQKADISFVYGRIMLAVYLHLPIMARLCNFIVRRIIRIFSKMGLLKNY